jgi:hypothetical protein
MLIPFSAVLAITMQMNAAVDVPAPLKPWVPWVMHGSERELCPARTDGVKVCEAPGSLTLVVDNKGASFVQTWRAFAQTIAPLPGDATRWPLDVEVDGKPAIVVSSSSTGGGPAVALDAGEHTVRGRFAWDALPESLAIPPATAAVRLTLSGREAAFVDRGEDGGRVWLQRQSAPEEREEDRLDVTAFRKVIDGVPLIVETQVLLEVSGKGREVTLPGALLAGFAPMALTSALPARVDGDALKVQVRPGRHALTLIARRDSDDRTLVSPKSAMGGEGSEEVWVFQGDHAVRVATIEGPPSIVPEQTRLPDAWRALPAYRVLPGDNVALVQQRRGDENPAPSQLSLQRTLWLDFSGNGYTVHDDIGGKFTGDRLAMGAGTTLGRVSTGDGPGDAFITQFANGTGVEVRSPQVRISADSRIEGDASSLPAVSWAHDFQSVGLTMHLPPGWRLAHASGVPVVQTTWINSWTLFELFLVVIITVAMGRLWGPLVGGAALMAMVLTFQEDGAPRGLWVLVVTLAALHKVLPASWETKAVATALRWLRMCAAIIVALVALVFSIQQVRMGMYPVLEQPHRTVGEGDTWGRAQYGGKLDDGSIVNLAANADQAQAQMEMPKMEPKSPSPRDEGGVFEELEQDMDKASDVTTRSLGKKEFASGYEGKVQAKKQRLLQIDPGSVVQTGPGLPQWGFTTVNMRFTGPVDASDRISLVLLSPTVNLVLAFLRVFLVAFLVIVAFGFPGSKWPSLLSRAFRGKGALFKGGAALVVALTCASSVRAEAPAPDHDTDAEEIAPNSAVLDELKRRLLAPPSCAPSCASISSVALDASETTLRMRAEVHALADVVVPLPGADKQWSAHTIIVDGRPQAGALREGGVLWVMLSQGRHDVVLEGALPRRDTVQLALPMVPHRATFASPGNAWTLDGVHEDGVPDANLQLSRATKGTPAASSEEGGEASVLPPFVRVERSLILGLSFEVETRVVRLSPAGSAVVLEIPLLSGESVTTDGVRAEGGKALVSLGPNDVEAHWSGVLPPTDKLVLEARSTSSSGASAPFVETWSLEASPVWHVEEEGIPPLHDETPRDGGARAWRPWPGEKLTLAITRPAGVAGQTITVEKTSQHVRPGVSSTDVTLTLVMRASRGGEHVVTLPEGAVLLGATIEGRAQPLRPDAKTNQVRVPIVPGKQTVTLEVRVPRGISFNFETPQFALGGGNGGKSVNAEVRLDVPNDRWVLFAWGPRAGPAVLFWSFFFVLVLTGIALSRVPFSPLKAHHWVLLGLGLTQVPIAVAAIVAGWLLALGWRKRMTSSDAAPMHAGVFNLFQLTLAFWTCIALVGLVASIHEGLLGAPDMQIEGNGSSQSQLRWFADHAMGALPTGHVINAPMAAYRLAMLAWALWLAFSLLKWLRFGWNAFSDGGLWRARPGRPARTTPTGARMPASSTEPPPGAPTSAAVPTIEKK